MIKPLVLSLSLLAAVALTQTARVSAEDTPAAAEKGKEAKQNRFPFRGKIAAIDLKEKTITLAGKERNRTFRVSDEAKITKDGKAAKLDEFAVGDEIGGLVSKNAAGQNEVISLRAGAKEKTAKTTQPKEKN